MHKEKTGEVRRGTWSHEEDKLLKACIEKYGEGNWHLVSERAGLNRCRKSCRLRWLNYLSPNINRDVFREDEIDMIQRLHNLLGNKWSLIAARLPGRTSNDVKNYWHTHLLKKKDAEKEEEEKKEKKKEKLKEIMKTHEVIKPTPRTLSAHFGKQPMLASNCAIETARVSNQHANCASASQSSLGNVPIPGEMWSDSLWNLEVQIGSEIIGSCSSLQENNYQDFLNPNFSFWDSNSNLDDFSSLWDS